MRGHKGGRRLLVGLVALAALALAGCSGGGGDQAGGVQSQPVTESGSSGPGVAKDQAGAGTAASPAAGAAVRLGDPNTKLVRTANVRLEVGKGRLSDTIDRASAVVTRLDGDYVGSSTTVPRGGSDDVATGQVTFRVPVAAYEQALRELKGLGRYLGEESSSKDVSSEYVDLNAQLKAWKAQEATYLKLLERARSINDVIAIQNQLSEAQQNIERLQGQINYLGDQSARSTIVLDLTEPGGAAVPKGRLARAWEVAWSGLATIGVATLVLLIWALPFALVGVGVVVVVRLLRRNRRAPVAPSAQA
jgi:hypothetical protein